MTSLAPYLMVDDVPPAWDTALAPHIYVFYAAFIISFIFTPVMRSIAMYYGIVDQPDARKSHKEPVAYLGGVAVFMGWVAGLAMSHLHLVGAEIGSPHLQVKVNIVLGAALIVGLGLWDDIRHISPRVKIAGQIAAAVLILSQGVGATSMGPIISPINVRLAELFGPNVLIPDFVMKALSAVGVILMVVGCCNATNLLDGLDGLCGGVTAVIAAGFLFLAVHLAAQTTADPNQPLGALLALNPIRIVLALALLGGVLGFVPFNFNPASIFMGDTGSMFLGYACAVQIVLLAEQQSKWLLAGMVMFALPILDTLLAFARRFVNRRPLFSPDRHHFHHQMVARGFSIKKTVLISYGLALAFCFLGAFIVYMRTRYAVAFYLVIFGSIGVAAYKMGMIHEKTDPVKPQTLDGVDAAITQIPEDTTSILEVDDRQREMSFTKEPASRAS